MELIFYLLAILMILSTVYLIFSSDIFKSFMAMFLVFFLTAIVYFIMGLKVIGTFQLIIYTGAIMVLFVVAMNSLAPVKDIQKKICSIKNFIYTFFVLVFGYMIYKVFDISYIYLSEGNKSLSYTDSISLLGKKMFSEYFLQIEVISLILFVAIVVAYNYLREEKNGI